MRGTRSPRSSEGPGPALERAHPSLQPHGFWASLKDFLTTFFFFWLLFTPTAEMQLAEDFLSQVFALCCWLALPYWEILIAGCILGFTKNMVPA